MTVKGINARSTAQEFLQHALHQGARIPNRAPNAEIRVSSANAAVVSVIRTTRNDFASIQRLIVEIPNTFPVPDPNAFKSTSVATRAVMW